MAPPQSRANTKTRNAVDEQKKKHRQTHSNLHRAGAVPKYRSILREPLSLHRAQHAADWLHLKSSQASQRLQRFPPAEIPNAQAWLVNHPNFSSQTCARCGREKLPYEITCGTSYFYIIRYNRHSIKSRFSTITHESPAQHLGAAGKSIKNVNDLTLFLLAE